jgi:hypothetical protein
MKLNTVEAVLFGIASVYLIMAIVGLILLFWFKGDMFLSKILNEIRQNFIAPFLAGGIIGYYSTKLKM